MSKEELRDKMRDFEQKLKQSEANKNVFTYNIENNMNSFNVDRNLTSKSRPMSNRNSPIAIPPLTSSLGNRKKHRNYRRK